MSALALRDFDASLFGRGSPSAGEAGNRIDREAYRAIGTLRGGTASPTSWIFNDLAALAQENGIGIRDSQTFRVAQLFLLVLPAHLPVPELSLDNDGEVVLDWASSVGRMLSVTLRGDGRITYALRLSALRRKRGVEWFENDAPQEILDCIQQVYSDR